MTMISLRDKRNGKVINLTRKKDYYVVPNKVLNGYKLATASYKGQPGGMNAEMRAAIKAAKTWKA